MAWGIVLVASATQASETYTFDQFGSSNSLSIPDGDASGVVDSRSIESGISAIVNISVTLDITADYNGDLYVYLLHGDKFAVLLNRVGKTADNQYGYSDSGMNVTLADNSYAGTDNPNAAMDIHEYQLTLQLPELTPLTGTWLADGRDVDPLAALDTTARTAGLEVFWGDLASGDWTLFLSDVNSGGNATLNSWSLTINPVPEPSTWALMIGGMALLGARRWRKR